jgi:ribose transport system substrate-binding protein
MVQVYYVRNRYQQPPAWLIWDRYDSDNSMEARRTNGLLSSKRSLVLTGAKWLVCTVLCSLTSCQKPVPTVAAIPRTCGTILWEAEHTGIQRVATTDVVNIYWNAPMREDDVQAQIEVLSIAIGHGVKGVIISPVEALPLRTPVHRALEHGTPIVVVGTDLGLTPGKSLSYVLNDERRGGEMAARRIASLLHGEGTVAVMGISNQLTSTAERARSLETTLAEASPGIQVVFRSLALPTASQEQQVAEKLLAKNPHVNAIVALSESSTRGAYYALTEFDKTSEIRLIGFDQNLLAPIRTGAIDSVIMQNTYGMGRAAMTLMNQELRAGAAQSQVVLEPLVVTKENIDSAPVREILDLRWFAR